MADQAPLFSIIIPTRRRPRQLRACLESVASLNHPRAAFEVIVVNDGGQPPYGDLVEETSARGRYLVFTDDDCRPESGWLGALERTFVEHLGAAVDGRIVNVLRSNIYSPTSQALIDYLYE